MKKISIGTKSFIIDDKDFKKLGKAEFRILRKTSHKDYVYIYIGKPTKWTSLAKFLLNPPLHKEVDHINGDSLDNRRENLRIVTHQQNQFNKKTKSNNKTGCKGIYFDKQYKNPWRASIGFNYKIIHLGNYSNKDEAAQAYKDAANKYFGEFARYN